MSKEDLIRQDIVLEGNTALWDMKLDGTLNGTYVGTFRFKCFLDPLQKIAADRERRELLGNQPAYASDHESFLAYAFCQLKYRIITSPPFWKTQMNGGASYDGNIADENIIEAVLNAAIASEIKYKKHLADTRGVSAKSARNSLEALLQTSESKEEKKDE